MQEKSRTLSGKQGEESMIWDKMSCINGWMVKSNLVISVVPYKYVRRKSFKDVSDLQVFMDYFALAGRSCENLNFPTYSS